MSWLFSVLRNWEATAGFSFVHAMCGWQQNPSKLLLSAHHSIMNSTPLPLNPAAASQRWRGTGSDRDTAKENRSLGPSHFSVTTPVLVFPRAACLLDFPIPQAIWPSCLRNELLEWVFQV